MYHIFRFEAFFPWIVNMKRGSSSEECTSFRLLKRDVSPEAVLTVVNEDKIRGTASIITKPLHDFPSVIESDQRSYLIKEFCDRFSDGDVPFVDS